MHFALFPPRRRLLMLRSKVRPAACVSALPALPPPLLRLVCNALETKFGDALKLLEGMRMCALSSNSTSDNQPAEQRRQEEPAGEHTWTG